MDTSYISVTHVQYYMSAKWTTEVWWWHNKIVTEIQKYNYNSNWVNALARHNLYSLIYMNHYLLLFHTLKNVNFYIGNIGVLLGPNCVACVGLGIIEQSQTSPSSQTHARLTVVAGNASWYLFGIRQSYSWFYILPEKWLGCFLFDQSLAFLAKYFIHKCKFSSPRVSHSLTFLLI